MPSIKLSIAEPCQEDWNAMLPEEKGRFCLSCQKTVVDFTNMSDGQVSDYFRNYKGNTCGQFSNDQLERDLTKPGTHSIGRWKYFWQILLPTFLAFQKLDAQPKVRGKVAPVTVCQPDTTKPFKIRMGLVTAPRQVRKTNYQIAGKLLNERKEPVPFATVTTTRGKYAVADSLGHFKIGLSDNESLTITQIGYAERTFTIDSLQTNTISGLKLENGEVVIETTIELKPSEINMPDAVVTGYGIGSRLTGIVGRLSVVTSKTLFTKQKRVNPDVAAPQLTTVPNPIRPGQNFQITFQVKKAGNYVLQIVDAAGRMMVNDKLTVVNKTQTELINGEGMQQAGIYILTLINPADRKNKLLTGKIVVQ